jgi:hypothetical protein
MRVLSTRVAVEPWGRQGDTHAAEMAASGVEVCERDVPNFFSQAVPGNHVGDPMTVVDSHDIEQAHSALDFDGITHQWNVHGGRYVTPEFDFHEEKSSEPRAERCVALRRSGLKDTPGGASGRNRGSGEAF